MNAIIRRDGAPVGWARSLFGRALALVPRLGPIQIHVAAETIDERPDGSRHIERWGAKIETK